MSGSQINKKILLFLVLTVGLFFPLHSQSKTIRNLQLNFVRQENYTNGNSSQMSGRIAYENDPFAFLFAVTVPENQTTYINSDGCYYADSEGLFDFSDNASVLHQTCKDFITWFKSDLALPEQNYRVQSSSVENGLVVSIWWYSGKEEVPVPKIKTYSDAYGRFVQLEMYAPDGSLITRTKLKNIKAAPGGFFYPETIYSETYTAGALLLTSTLSFSEVRFNSLEGTGILGNVMEVPEIKKFLETTSDSQIASVPPEKSYRVSIPAIITGAGFTVYKKFITNQDMSACRFEPSCSQYMLQAVSKYGIFGVIKGLERLKRCTSAEHSRNIYPVLENGKHYDPVN